MSSELCWNLPEGCGSDVEAPRGFLSCLRRPRGGGFRAGSSGPTAPTALGCWGEPRCESVSGASAEACATLNSDHRASFLLRILAYTYVSLLCRPRLLRLLCRWLSPARKHTGFRGTCLWACVGPVTPLQLRRENSQRWVFVQMIPCLRVFLAPSVPFLKYRILHKSFPSAPGVPLLFCTSVSLTVHPHHLLAI